MVSKLTYNLKKISWHQFALILLVIFPILCLWQISLFQNTLKFDMMDQYFPFRYFTGECISNGIIPWWNPYIYLGYPFYADPQSGFWYPLTWILGINGYSVYDLHLEFMFHIIFAGYGLYYLLRCLKIEVYYALIFAMCYEVCGFFIGNAQHFTYIIGACYLPWILACFIQILHVQKYICGIALSFFLSLLISGGYPAITIILIYILALYFLYTFFEEKLWRIHGTLLQIFKIFFIVAILTSILSAGYFASIIETHDLITRGDGVSAEKSLYMPFPPLALISLILPFFTALKSAYIHSDISMINAYCGLISIIFLPIGLFFKRWKGKAFWITIGFISLLASFGESTPFRLWLYYHVPFMNLFRFPSIFRIFFILSMLIIAAHGLQYMTISKTIKARKVLKITLFILLFLSISAFVLGLKLNGELALFHFWDYDKEALLKLSENEYTRLIFQASIQFVYLICFYILFRKNPLHLKKWLLLLIIIDLYTATQLNMSGTVVSKKSVYRYNWTLSQNPNNFPNSENTKLSDLRQYDESLIPSCSNQTIFFKNISDNGYNPFQLKKFILFEQSKDRKITMQNPIFYLSNSLENVKVITMLPNYFEARIDIKKDDTLNLLQTYSPEWTLKIDNHLTRIIEKNNGLMAAKVSAKNHTIVFEYKPNYLKLLLWVQFILQIGIVITILLKKIIRIKS